MFYLFTREQKLEALQSLETVDLLNKAYSRVDELSGGQRQRKNKEICFPRPL